MASSLESLEEKFREVELANERRVLDGHELWQTELVDPSKRYCRKKPGISVSQFGKEGQGDDVSSQHCVPSPLFAAASRSTLYHTLANPRSVDSFVSADLEDGTRHTEEQHEIQIERIIGRQTLPTSMGALLPRRLTRAQSQLGYFSIDRHTVIDVSVETTTESSHPSQSVKTSTAFATRPSRPRAATMDDQVPTSHGGWAERTKDFTRKLRQKAKAERQ